MTDQPLAYRRHTENARDVRAGLTQAERVHKAAIRSGQRVAIDFAARVHHLTVGMLAEALLRKLIADPDGFNERERELLAKERSQIDRWQRAVELAFRRHYSVPIHLDIQQAVGAREAEQFATISALLGDELSAIISDRNKLAHGQWAWLLNSGETAFKGEAPAALNYRAVLARSRLVSEIAEMVSQLAISEPTFVRDYEDRYERIEGLLARLPGDDYETFVAQLRSTRR